MTQMPFLTNTFTRGVFPRWWLSWESQQKKRSPVESIWRPCARPERERRLPLGHCGHPPILIKCLSRPVNTQDSITPEPGGGGTEIPFVGNSPVLIGKHDINTLSDNLKKCTFGLQLQSPGPFSEKTKFPPQTWKKFEPYWAAEFWTKIRLRNAVQRSHYSLQSSEMY